MRNRPPATDNPPAPSSKPSTDNPPAPRSKLAEASDDHGKEKEETKPVTGDGSQKQCMVYAEGLDITWYDDRRYWKWVPHKEAGDEHQHKIAELLSVCWLEVSGKLATEELSPGTLYQVVFEVKMKPKAYGWDAPVNFKFTPPDGTDQWKTITLTDELKDSKDKWKEITVGEFKAPENPGNIEFSLYEHGGKWKSGLVIKRVAVRPKTNAVAEYYSNN